MRGPTCIFWANLTPCSLEGCEHAGAVVGAPGLILLAGGLRAVASRPALRRLVLRDCQLCAVVPEAAAQVAATSAAIAPPRRVRGVDRWALGTEELLAHGESVRDDEDGTGGPGAAAAGVPPGRLARWQPRRQEFREAGGPASPALQGTAASRRRAAAPAGPQAAAAAPAAGPPADRAWSPAGMMALALALADGFAEEPAALTPLPRLAHVDLAQNELRDAGLAALAPGLAALPALTALVSLPVDTMTRTARSAARVVARCGLWCRRARSGPAALRDRGRRLRGAGRGARRRRAGGRGADQPGPRPERARRARASEKDAELAQKLGQLQPFLAVFSQECMANLHLLGQPNTFRAARPRSPGCIAGCRGSSCSSCAAR